MRSPLLLLLTALAGAQEAVVQVPGLAGRHPLDQEGVGAVLIDELRCAACHEAAGPAALPGPDLTDVGARLAPGYLARFLADPTGTQPGTKMPHVVPSMADARDLAAFLSGTAGEAAADAIPGPDEVAEGRALFHEVGCVACHAPREAPPDGQRVPEVEGAVALEHVPAKYTPQGLAGFLFKPLEVRPSGRMPDLGLTRGEARALASYLLEGAPRHLPGAERADAAAAARGRAAFTALGCAACHAHPAAAAASPRRSAPLAAGQGCLAPEPEAAPRYALDDEARAAIAAALGGAPPAPAERLARTLTQLNCIACHTRDDYGGVDPARYPYLQTDEPDLGNDARVPPPLTLAGAKLRSDWLSLVLFDGKSVRPYMHTRMPRFGEANVDHLPALLASLDEVEPYPAREPERGDEDRAWRDAGRGLLGNQGLACIACHDFNGKPSPTFRGVDLILSPERLRYDWFAQFLIAPQRYRPGVVMPESWPGGVAAHDGFLEGDTEAQVQAIWHFLRLGRSAADPPGIVRERTELQVEDRVRTYRGRSGVAGFRGIAVGYPGGLSYAFDAYTGALAALWRGEFVSVYWQGQGAGDFNPIGRPAKLERDVAFARLPSQDAPWPARPVTTKEEPVDPDPTYPWANGYRFLGYHLDADDVPTLRYRTGEVTVEDRSEADLTGERPVLRRTLRLDAPAAETVYLRLLVGDLERVSATTVRTPELALTHPARPTLERPLGEGAESLLRLDLEPGTTTLVLDYELLR